MVCGDFNYCDELKILMNDAAIKRVNRCKTFELNPIDALGENPREYRPRREKPGLEVKQECIPFDELLQGIGSRYEKNIS